LHSNAFEGQTLKVFEKQALIFKNLRAAASASAIPICFN
jgi:hypothetical protein